jgi:hypothetical protein
VSRGRVEGFRERDDRRVRRSRFRARCASNDLVNEVRKELRSLPSYGVFDLLTFVANPDGSVVLAGYVVNSSLKTDAEKAIAGIKA